MVTWPWLFRPPVFRIGSSRLFSGVARVISSNPDTERNRDAAVTGLNCRMVISALEHGDLVPFLQGDDRLLPPGRSAAGLASHHLVAPHLHGANPGHGHAEQILQRLGYLILVRLGMPLEGLFLPQLIGGGALLGHDRADDHLVQRGHLLAPLLLL